MLCGVVGAGNWMRLARLPALGLQKDCNVVGFVAVSLRGIRGICPGILTIDRGVSAA